MEVHCTAVASRVASATETEADNGWKSVPRGGLGNEFSMRTTRPLRSWKNVEGQSTPLLPNEIDQLLPK